MVGSGPDYLTRFDGQLDPQQITDDIHFSTAASDQGVPVAEATPTVASGAAHGPSDTTSAPLYIGIGIAAVLLGTLGWFALRNRRA